MAISKEIETLARMWMVCDPNRSGDDADHLIGQYCEGLSDGNVRCVDTELTGMPRWHWFIPRAEASVEYLRSQGLRLTEDGLAPVENV